MGARHIAGRWIRRLSGQTLMVRSLERELVPRLSRLSSKLSPGSSVLDIGAKSGLYRPFFPHSTFHTLDLEAEHQPDFVADLLEMDKVVPEKSYDLILCTEVLEHIPDPKLAIDQIHRALKPSGVMLASTPFIVPYHPYPEDYWRMTGEAWRLLTKRFRDVEVVPHGNQVLSTWYLAGMGYGMPLRILDPLVFRAFGRLRGAFVFLGLMVEARM
jgi:SAM-dependent methyltransferase